MGSITYKRFANLFDIVYILVISFSTITLAVGIFFDFELLIYIVVATLGMYISLYQFHPTLLVVYGVSEQKLPIFYSKFCVTIGFKTVVPIIVLLIFGLFIGFQTYLIDIIILLIPITLVTILMNYPLALTTRILPGFDIVYKGMYDKDWEKQRRPWDDREI